jgi:hypothetical protein
MPLMASLDQNRRGFKSDIDKPKGYLLPDFYSGATGLPGRFSDDVFLLRPADAFLLRR